MIKLTVLDGHALNPGDLSWKPLHDIADVTVYERTPPELAAERIADSAAILLNKVRIDEKILSKCPNLRYIGVLATGYNVIDLDAAAAHGITVTNIPSYSTDAVAQHVFALITYFTNSVALHAESVRKGGWTKSPDFCYWERPLTELAGKTLGVLGFGHIGKKVCAIGEAFGMRTIFHTRTPPAASDAESVPFDELFSRSDFLSLHVPLSAATERIVNARTLSLMKPSAILINTARGGCVDEKELAAALNCGRIAGYAADVSTEEPMDGNSPLLHAENCIITPHIAWAPLETRKRLLGIAADNLKSWLAGTAKNTIY